MLHLRINLNNSLLIRMKIMESQFNLCTCFLVNHWQLGKVSEIEEGADCNEKASRDSPSNDQKYIELDITMLTPSNLLQSWDSLYELTKGGVWMKHRKMVIHFCSTNGIDTPLYIMIPKLFVPVVKRLWCQKDLKDRQVGNHAKMGGGHHSNKIPQPERCIC